MRGKYSAAKCTARSATKAERAHDELEMKLDNVSTLFGRTFCRKHHFFVRLWSLAPIFFLFFFESYIKKSPPREQNIRKHSNRNHLYLIYSYSSDGPLLHADNNIFSDKKLANFIMNINYYYEGDVI